MKLDIENKILIPFVILVILPIIIIGIVSYLGGYEILMENQNKNLKIRLQDSIQIIDLLKSGSYENTADYEDNKNQIIKYLKQKEYRGMFIIENNHIILNAIQSNENISEELIDKILDQKRGSIKTEDGFVIFEDYDDLDWTIGYKVVKRNFTNDLLEIQKYTILVAIIFSIFSVQATILIAHNISKPIKVLVDNCNSISIENFKRKVDISRKDEIGILAQAFNNMINKLQVSTDNLLEMKEFNENILRSITTGIITTDRQGNIISINQAALKIFKYSLPSQLEKEEIIQRILIKQVKSTINSKKSIHEMYSFNTSDNEKIHLDVTTSLLINEKKDINGAICSINDITKRKKIENRMEKINRLASLGQLAAGLAHEIRNPLAGMKTSIQVLKSRFKESTSGSSTKLFNGILYEIDRLNNLIVELLDFAKPHYPKYENANIVSLLNKSIDLTQKAIDKKKININIFINTKNNIAFVDKAQIEQVFLNIITNSIRAVKNNGIINIVIDSVFNEKGDSIVIKFQDNGCGINEENIEKIFNPFFTTESQGTGLGLSVVHKLIIENNGEIEVESAVDVGTIFTIKLPMGRNELDEEKSINN